MNKTVFFGTWRERLSHPIRLACVIGFFLHPLVVTFFDPEPELSGHQFGVLFTVILASGIIGQEVSTGVLALNLTRPVRRSEYIFSKWLSISTLAAIVSVLQITVQGVVLHSMMGLAPWRDILLGSAERLFLSFGISAVFVLFSTLGPSLTDLTIFLGLSILSRSLQIAGAMVSVRSLVFLGRQLEDFLNPWIDMNQFLLLRFVPWHSMICYLSTLLACLALAVFFLNRKELSYAS